MATASPLDAEHRTLGATFTTFAGWSMPVRYESDLAEHHAVRRAVGVFDLSHMGEIELTGPEAGEVLDHALVNELSSLSEGRARYSVLCAEDGGVLDDLIVYRTDGSRYLAVVNAANTAVAHQQLRVCADGFDAEVRDVTAATALVAVQGPDAVELLTPLSDVDPASLRTYGCAEAIVADIPLLLARTGYTGEDGFELYCHPDAASALWAAIMGNQDVAEVRPCGLAARDTLRLEAGMPLYGHELTRERTPFDAGLGRLVRFDRPTDFIGRAALEQRGPQPPAQQLVGLVGDGRRAPRAGYQVSDDAGAAAGEVTSGALSPTLERPIAMAYVRPELAEPGTKLLVDVRGRQLATEVVELPFYRRQR